MFERRTAVLLAGLTAAALLTISACGSSSTSATASSNSVPAGGSTSAVASGASPSTSAPLSSAPASSAPASSAPESSAPESSAAGTAGIAGCTPDTMKTKTAGTLTIATDNPAYDPWFSGNNPANGKGFESAVAYAVAGKLGFAKDKVKWIKVSFNAAVSPAPKDFDFDINEFTITADRAKAVDFSTGYYDVTQAVVTVKGSKVADAKTIADLKSAKLGAQIGTTSLDALNKIIAPSTKPTIFQTNDTAVTQLKNGQVDGIVVDTPTAFTMAAAQLDNGLIVGQLPSGGGAPAQFGLLLDKGSSLTACAGKAVDALRADGTLTTLQTTWLTEAGAPVLK